MGNWDILRDDREPKPQHKPVDMSKIRGVITVTIVGEWYFLGKRVMPPPEEHLILKGLPQHEQRSNNG